MTTLGSPAAAVKASVPSVPAPKSPTLTPKGTLSSRKPAPATSVVHPAPSLSGDRSASLPPPPGGALAPSMHNSPPTKPSPSLGEAGSIFNKGASMPAFRAPYTPHVDFDLLVKQAAAAGLARSKAAAEVCEDDERSKKEKEKEKAKEKENEEKSASIRQARSLAVMNVKIASLLKQGNGPELPTSDISNISGSIPSDFGEGKQQPHQLHSLPATAELPTMDASEAVTSSASPKLKGLVDFVLRRKQANEAALATMSAEQAAHRTTPTEDGIPSFLSSNEGLINATKADGSPAKRKALAEAFQEPALNRSTDSTVSDAFQNTPGDKMASSRDLFARLQREVNR